MYIQLPEPFYQDTFVSPAYIYFFRYNPVNSVVYKYFLILSSTLDILNLYLTKCNDCCLIAAVYLYYFNVIFLNDIKSKFLIKEVNDNP